VRRGGLWAKHMGLKRGAIGNTLGEHTGNIWNRLGTNWEHVGNKGKMKKKSSPPRPSAPNPKLKRKKMKSF